MKQIFNFISIVLIFVGIVIMAGSAGDCDGRCGPGNSISEMLMLAGIGLSFFITGALVLISNSKEEA
jgi:hypothetical protein